MTEDKSPDKKSTEGMEKAEREEAEQESFKVADKRRFDSEGNRKEGADEKAATKKDSSPKIEEATADVSVAEGAEAVEQAGAQEINFSAFVMSLATQALMQLGEMEPPPGVNVEVNPLAAHQTIEILAMLQEKTKGNLDEQESNLIEEMLHHLRIGFVRSQGSS